jgi:hypothetical protein
VILNEQKHQPGEDGANAVADENRVGTVAGAAFGFSLIEIEPYLELRALVSGAMSGAWYPDVNLAFRLGDCQRPAGYNSYSNIQ